MNLPNFYFADLPLESHPDAQSTMICSCCRHPEANCLYRQKHLLSRSTESIVKISLCEVAHDWLAAG